MVQAKKSKKGFTIVELVIVIAVIAILAAVLIPTFATIIEKANKSDAVQAIKSAYSEYLSDQNGQTTVVKNKTFVYCKKGDGKTPLYEATTDDKGQLDKETDGQTIKVTKVDASGTADWDGASTDSGNSHVKIK